VALAIAAALAFLQPLAAAEDADAGLLQAMAELASDDATARKAAIETLAHSRDLRLIPFFDDYGKGNVYRLDRRMVLAPETRRDDQGIKHADLLDPLSRQPLLADGHPLSVALSALAEVSPSRKERTLVRDALVLLRLSDPDRERRLAAVQKAGDNPAPANLAALDELAPRETDARIRTAIDESAALIRLAGDGTPAGAAAQVAAARRLGELRSSRALTRLQELAAGKGDPDLVAACGKAVAAIESWQSVAHGVGYVFSGLSLGSVLVLMALGLSIIFGLMGVINMAHGELMMIGAYATYATQQAFVHWLPPGAHDWYFPVAIPVAFAAAAAVGLLIEWAVIRHLYGRPLDTLLATWGVGWILIQAVRLQFGDNIAVNSPTYLQGGMEVASDIVLPYARLFIIAFTVACIAALYITIDRTRLGLLLRATTQNRAMAAALGVPTRRIDGMTFALGSGIAGMAGCALTLIGGVTPDMGQNYIVDSFMVVVTGGVGKLAGAIWAGMGLGIADKLFEPYVQAVWAKVIILILVIAFIQWRPSGLFPAKGRLADA
jgi:urea transport system permease protein